MRNFKLSLILTAFLLTQSAYFASDAAVISIGDFKYSTNTDGTAVLMGLSSSAGPTKDLTIPGQITYNNKVYQVTTINSSAFSGIGTGVLTIEEGVVTIKDQAFQSSRFDAIKLPSTLESYGDKAFDVTYSNLEYVYCAATYPPRPIKTGYPGFADALKRNTPLLVPSSSVSRYQSAWEWKEFKTIKAYVLPSGIRLDPVNASVTVGETIDIKAIITPDDAFDKSVVWSSSNPTVATIANGKVSGKSVGSVTITATSANGLKATSTISVLPKIVNAQSITLTPTNVTMKPAENITLLATILPSNTTDKSLSWSSDNENVAVVNDNGKVTAIGVGNATISVTTTNGLVATCAVSVIPIPITSITVNPTEVTLTISQTIPLTVIVLPVDATDKSVTWASGDENVATVDQSGTVTAVGNGETLITATTNDGSGLSASSRIIVTTPVGVESIPEDGNAYVDIFTPSGLKIYSGKLSDWMPQYKGLYILHTSTGIRKVIR